MAINYRDKLLQMTEGDPELTRDALIACLKWMSLEQVKLMMEANQFYQWEED